MGGLLAFSQLSSYFDKAYAGRPAVLDPIKRRGLMKCIKYAKRRWHIEELNPGAYREAIEGCKVRYKDAVNKQEPERNVV